MNSITTDRHANARDRKRDKAMKSKFMRGNRSVFTIQEAIAKRGREARSQMEHPNDSARLRHL